VFVRDAKGILNLYFTQPGTVPGQGS
jgi:hypothetical protein